MNSPCDSATILRRLAHAPDHPGRFLSAPSASVRLDDLLAGTSLGGRRPDLSGRSVLIRTRDPLTAGLALIELDGVARRLVLCPPDLSSAHIPSVVATAGVDAIVSDRDLPDQECVGVPLRVQCSASIAPASASPVEERETEWILLTSGTTGAPKMIAHSLRGLTAAI